MIIKNNEEFLVNLYGTQKVDAIGLDGLIDKAHGIRDSFKKLSPSRTSSRKFYMDASRNFIIPMDNGTSEGTDISEYAFGQFCTLHGVPAQYMKKCYDLGMDDLVNINLDRQAERMKEEGRDLGSHVALVSDGVTEAIVSNKYSFGFQTPEVLETIRECMPGQYQANQAYLSKARAHIRFVDFDNPVDVNGEKMSVGFTVGTSDIGKSALRVQFFIYKFACKNGIVRVSHGGTLYKQTHIGEPFTRDNIDSFKRAFSDVTLLRETALKEIANAQSKILTDREMQSILDTSRRYQVNLSEEARDNIITLATERYGRTAWGVINGITERAQEYTLDTRLNFEAWAGHLLQAA